MFNFQLPMKGKFRRTPVPIGYWVLVIGCSLLLVACGGGNDTADNEPAGPRGADLEGEQTDKGFNPATPAIDISDAPTEVHEGLARLLPTQKALDKDSVTYRGWDAAGAEISEEDPEEASVPAVYAEYHSAGYDVLKDEEGETEELSLEYPQDCKLFIIRAPEDRAAELIEENIRAKMIENGFQRIDPIEFVSGRGNSVQIPRYSRVDDAGEYDSVFVGYLKVFGDLVVYALETETPPTLDTGESRLSRVSEGGGGSRVGGRLISLLHLRLENAE